MDISVIIPTYNESKNLQRLIPHLRLGGNPQIIVSDGQSDDDTVIVCRQLQVQLVQCQKRGRAHQLNRGAAMATGDILYFVHADTLPPKSYQRDIIQSLTNGAELGCYRFKFDNRHPLLRINSFFTRFDRLWCRGGDQSLFLSRSTFAKLNGFSEHMIIMEEYEFIERAREKYKFAILPKDIMVSARKYEENGYLRVQLANLKVFQMYKKKRAPEEILATYRKMIHCRA
ncbi:MAG: TIGR04283 family arsenosugar biosynthesis glycosyltransferase [Saprospiraceae bacterium]|nr:TIGR04283 family arsenosugar biosynthesis glycosyltransferase [Saprospiraceae bacterium]